MIDTIPKLFKDYTQKNANQQVQLSKDKEGVFQPVTWKELYEHAKNFGAGLLSLKVKRGDHIGIISDNMKEWLAADLAILGIGAADVPRGSDTMADEIKYILGHAECRITLAENQSQLEKILSIKDSLGLLKTIIVMDKEFVKTASRQRGVNILTFREVLDKGKDHLKSYPGCFEEEIEKNLPGDLATIIYTSGTTGEPKGVMLSHKNYMHQVRAPLSALDIRQGDVFLSILPVWHSYERAVEYFAIFAGCILAYSKPITQAIVEDMGKVRPMIFPSIPRVWESIKTGINRKFNEAGGIKKALAHFFLGVGAMHSRLKIMFRGLKPQFKRRIRALDMLLSFIPLILLTPLNLLGQVLVFKKIKHRLGGRFKFGVSGAGALPPHVDDFFAASGVLLLEGYGLTETAPFVSVRNSSRPVSGTIGTPMPEVEVKVLDEQGKELPPCRKGVLYVKGPNVMMGYYKNPELTAQTISEDGWLNTGDLAMLTHKGEIRILGRAKETIVLLGGENVEPNPIEDTITESTYIDQVMVVGQDQRYLAALVVPNMENLESFAKENGIPFNTVEDLIEDSNISHLVMDEINSRVSYKRGFRLFEMVNRVKLLSKPFEKGKEISHTLKLKRNVINESHKKEIAELFK